MNIGGPKGSFFVATRPTSLIVFCSFFVSLKISIFEILFFKLFRFGDFFWGGDWGGHCLSKGASDFFFSWVSFLLSKLNFSNFLSDSN